MRWLFVLTALGVMGGTQWALEAQDAPEGWKVVKDAQGACQLTVPANWVDGKAAAALVRSMDGKLNATPASAPEGKTFADVAASARATMQPTKTLEATGSRVWFRYIGLHPAGGANLYVAINSSPVCTAQITYRVPEAEETAKKIALSLSAVPPKQ